MKDISLKFKVAIFLTTAMILVFGAFFLQNVYNQKKTIVKIYQENNQELQFSISDHIETLMLIGANEDLQPMIERLHQNEIASEITIVDNKKNISRSTDKSKIGKKSDDAIWAEIFETLESKEFEKEIDGVPYAVCYKVYQNKPACQECHDPAEGNIIGGLKIVKSEEKLVSSIASSFWLTLIFGCLGGILIISGVLFYMHRRVFKPLSVVQGKLDLASVGEIDQTITVESNDEIGHFFGSIKKLIDYIKEFAYASHEIASGNLLVQVNPKSKNDQLGNSFRLMTDNLTWVVNELSQNSNSLNTVAEEIKANSNQVADGASNQSGQITRVAAALEEMNATIRETSRHTSQVSQVARSASETAAMGREVVDETINGILKISEVVRSSSESISSLSQSALQIGDIIDVIDEIADQTNLLALNAAIEAARAGDQGRGFAVVADEVRKLAERTGKATGEIAAMIKSVQSQTKSVVIAMNEGISEVNRGRELSDQASESLSSIVDMSNKVLQMIEQIATASEQQSVTSNEITQNVDHITSVTNQTEIVARRSSNSSFELNEQAESLRKIVGMFNMK